MKTYLGVEVLLHSFFDLGTRWRSVVSFTPRPLYLQGKSPQYPLDRKLGGPQSRSWHGVEEKNSQPSSGIEPRLSDHPARSQSQCRLTDKLTVSYFVYLHVVDRRREDVRFWTVAGIPEIPRDWTLEDYRQRWKHQLHNCGNIHIGSVGVHDVICKDNNISPAVEWHYYFLHSKTDK
jgi:hypothetical protein